ncbi:MAG: CAP domain-containing protein [Pseudomonadota bacterium]
MRGKRRGATAVMLAVCATVLAGCFVVVPVPVSTTRAVVPIDNCRRALVKPKKIDRAALAVDFYKPTANDSLSETERQLYEAIMAHRASIGLPRIPLSKSLTLVAGRHAEDMQKNLMPSGGLKPGTNYHSWSDVDYYEDHRNAKLMWQAPRRFGTSYCGNGYEISAWGYSTWRQTLDLWIASDYHGPVIENRGAFKNLKWRAIGIGVAESNSYGRPVYHVWFGEAKDPAGTP